MKKLILASVSGIALMGLAACSDTDETTTQALPDQNMDAPASPDAPLDAAPTEPADPAPMDDSAPPAQ